MKSLERAVGTLIAIVACGGLASIGIVACTDDTATGSPDASLDGTADVTADHQTDAPVVPDSGDAGDAADGTSLDAAETSTDAKALLAAYPALVTTAFCQHLAKCCAAFDAGTFDQKGCEAPITASGGFQQVGLATAATTGGRLAYDPAAAAACLADIAALDCVNDPSSHWTKTRADCWAAMNGTQPEAGTCASSYECAPGLYCSGAATDAGACKPIEALDGGCTEGANFACTYQQNGLTPAHWCDSTQGTTCVAQKSAGAACGADRECSTGICNSDLCLGAVPGPTTGLCTFLVVKDAGTD